jgi:hypothetical protein
MHDEQSTGNLKRPAVVCGVGEILAQGHADIRLTTLTKMRIDSTVREATYPRATLSLTRFTCRSRSS